MSENDNPGEIEIYDAVFNSIVESSGISPDNPEIAEFRRAFEAGKSVPELAGELTALTTKLSKRSQGSPGGIAMGTGTSHRVDLVAQYREECLANRGRGSRVFAQIRTKYRELGLEQPENIPIMPMVTRDSYHVGLGPSPGGPRFTDSLVPIEE